MIQPYVILRYPVQSSILASVGYCAVTCIFDVELRNGTLYRYYGVPAHICWNLLCADSKGRYFNQQIRSAFRHQRFSPPLSSKLQATSQLTPMVKNPNRRDRGERSNGQ
jgi:hypothetical protein